MKGVSREIFWSVPDGPPLRFATGSYLGLGVAVVGVVEQLTARLAVRPEDAGVAAAGIGHPRPPPDGFPSY